MIRGRTGRRTLGEIEGRAPRLKCDNHGRLRQYRVRLAVADAVRLASVLAEAVAANPRHRIFLAATKERLGRLRLISSPPPQYELRAATHHALGDILRVTGTEQSCNVVLAPHGVEVFGARLQVAAQEARAWVELRFRIVHRRSGSQQSLVEFIPDVEAVGRMDEPLALAAESAAAEILAPEDFSDWEDKCG